MSTTGTGTGSDFSGLNDAMKIVYSDAFENNIEAEMEVLDFIKVVRDGFEIIDGPDGKQINLAHFFSSGGGVGAMNEDDYFYASTNPEVKQSNLNIKTLSATVQLSGRTLRRVKKGPAAFVTWANEALPRKAQRLAYHRDRMAIGAGTGIIGRVNMTVPDADDLTLDSAYGIAGLDGVLNLILRGDNLKFSPNANGSSPRALTATVNRVDYALGNIDINQLPTDTADNDYVFLGDDNVQSSNSREPMGFEGLIDNGDVLATLQGLLRADYPELKSQVVDASTGDWAGTLSEDLLDYTDAECWEHGNLGQPSHILVNRRAQRAFWRTLRADRVLNDPKGDYQGGKAKLKMMLGSRLVTVQAARKVPPSRCYMVDPRSIKRFKVGAGRWDDTPGSVWQRVTDANGRKDAYYAVYILEENLGIGDPAQSAKIKNLSTTM